MPSLPARRGACRGFDPRSSHPGHRSEVPTDLPIHRLSASTGHVTHESRLVVASTCGPSTAHQPDRCWPLRASWRPLWCTSRYESVCRQVRALTDSIRDFAWRSDPSRLGSPRVIDKTMSLSTSPHNTAAVGSYRVARCTGFREPGCAAFQSGKVLQGVSIRTCRQSGVEPLQTAC